MASRDLYGMEAADVVDSDDTVDAMPAPVPQSAEAALRQISA
jgi:phosphonate transport system ATP-binding protein